MSTTPFENLFPAMPRIDRKWEARKERLMAMTAAQRLTAMRAGQLTYRELCHWSAMRPDEVPILSTGSGLGGGEFEWITGFIPEIAEAPGPIQDAQPRNRASTDPRELGDA
jgi:hypothetical protein